MGSPADNGLRGCVLVTSAAQLKGRLPVLLRRASAAAALRILVVKPANLRAVASPFAAMPTAAGLGALWPLHVAHCLDAVLALVSASDLVKLEAASKSCRLAVWAAAHRPLRRARLRARLARAARLLSVRLGRTRLRDGRQRPAPLVRRPALERPLRARRRGCARHAVDGTRGAAHLAAGDARLALRLRPRHARPHARGAPDPPSDPAGRGPGLMRVPGRHEHSLEAGVALCAAGVRRALAAG